VSQKRRPSKTKSGKTGKGAMTDADRLIAVMRRERHISRRSLLSKTGVSQANLAKAVRQANQQLEETGAAMRIQARTSTDGDWQYFFSQLETPLRAKILTGLDRLEPHSVPDGRPVSGDSDDSK
jgi:hypothetical protein